MTLLRMDTPALLRRFNDSPVHPYKFTLDPATFFLPDCVEAIYRLTPGGEAVSSAAIRHGHTLLVSAVGVGGGGLHLLGDDHTCRWHETFPGTLTPDALNRWVAAQLLPGH